MKEFIILSKRFVKFKKTADNEWQVSRIHDFAEGEIEGIVDRAIVAGKVIFVYDRHYPEDTREIVGEIDTLCADNGEIKAAIKWNEYGKKILGSETRYPSVELVPCPTDETVWDLRAVAMVGEPASDAVDVLTLSATEKAQDIGGANMDEQVKEILVKGMENPDSMREELAKLFPDAVPLIEAIVDTLIEMNKGGDGGGEEVEAEELSEEEGKAKEEETDAKEDEAKEDEDEGEAKEEEAEAKADEQKAKEELTALAYEYGARFDLGVPAASTLKEAVARFVTAKKARMPKADAQEYAFKALKFVKAAAKKDESLSAGEKGKQTLSPAEELGSALRG